MNTKKKITELMDEYNVDLTDLVDYLKIDKKMVKKAAKKKENEKEYSKIRLTPVSFSKVGTFFRKGLLKLKSKMASEKLEKQEKKLASLQERIVEGAVSQDELARIAFKVAQLEEKIRTLEYQSRIEGNVRNRALKLKGAMKNQLVQGADNLYYFEKNPFNQNTTKAKENNTPSPLELQLDDDLAKEVSPVSNPQPEEKSPTSIETQLENSLGESDPVLEPVKVPTMDPVNDDSNKIPIDSEGYQNALDAKKRRIAEENHYLDNYLLNNGANTYHLTQDEIIQDRPTLAQDKEQLLDAMASLRNDSSQDYIKREYQSDLDRVNELIRRNYNSPSVENSSSHNLTVDASLTDLIKAAEEEERRAQELADQARLAKEEALQAAREKDEKQRMALETDERYRQLLQEAKVTIEARSQRARERAEQERLELARNRELVDGIRRDSQEIAAKVAQRQNDISQLESVLGQYKGDNASRSSIK